uniref:Uncharacterized protein n=1 Tax=Tanacetum cinerariifolium TaxID=118510 RepID=A0A6L2NPJ2_TANCI|nr:hypothetical protein [Tanacetum cinerariifolium]
MDVEIEQDDLNQKVLTSLAPEWLMYTIVWRNRDDLDTMSLDDVYNHLKLADVAAASISHDTICAYIASQSNGSQIKYKDITQTDEDDIKEMDIQWSALISTRWAILLESAEHPGAKKWVEKKQGSKEEESAPKALMAIDRIGWDWSYMANEEENHALVADDEAPIEFALIVKSSSSSENEVKKEKEGLDSKLTGFESASKDLDTLLGSQRTDKNKEGLRYSVVPHFLLKLSPSIKSNTNDLQNSNSSVSELGESSGRIMSKPMIKFVKAANSPGVIKTNKTESARKPPVKYAEIQSHLNVVYCCCSRQVSTVRPKEVINVVRRNQESLLVNILYRTPWPIKGVLRSEVVDLTLGNISLGRFSCSVTKKKAFFKAYFNKLAAQKPAATLLEQQKANTAATCHKSDVEERVYGINHATHDLLTGISNFDSSKKDSSVAPN